MSTDEQYDVIVIGSGMGALALGSILAKLKKSRVLILERHFKIGGFTHTFTRPGGWKWDVGLHYVGDMGKGMQGRRLMDLVTGGEVQWNELPDPYDVFEYPGFTFGAVKGEENLRRALKKSFSKEAAAIDRYFSDIKAATAWFRRSLMQQLVPTPLASLIRAVNYWSKKIPLITTGKYLEQRFQDPRLRALLASQWGDYGLPPAQSAFVTHALIVSHYLEGAWYPDGGADGIAHGAGAAIRAAGGALLPNHEVTKILVKGGRAVGVEVNARQGKESKQLQFFAPVVVSDAGAWNTFAKLLPTSIPLPFRAELSQAPEGYAMVSLFLGLKEDPRSLGFDGANHWLFRSYDHDEIDTRRGELAKGHAMGGYLSFPSMKDQRVQQHTAEILAPFPHEMLMKHQNEPWQRRSEGYRAMKEKISDALINLVEERHPGFRQLVEYQELSTPLTFKHFTGAPSGAIYGYPATPERYRNRWLQVRTPVKGLLLTGSDACSLGIMGALMGGVVTASVLLGPSGFLQIMRATSS